MKNKLLFLASFILLFLSHTSAFASHFRGGRIEWSRTANSNIVTFKVYSVWREDDTDPISLNFGDGQSVSLTGNEILFQDDYRVIESVVVHTYANSGNFTAYYSSCCRISTTQNSPDDNFNVATTVCLSSNNLNSPSSNTPFVLELTQGNLNQLQLSGFDNDGSSVSFSTSVLTSATYIPTAGGNTLSISPSGQLLWNTNGTALGQLWQLKYKISDGCGEIEMDIIIKIVQSTCPIPLGIISGNATLQSGQTTNLTLSFTGAAPWNYDVSNIGSGTTTTNPLVIPVSSTQTTTYVLNSISNGCGNGNTSGSAKVVICSSSNPSTASISGSTTIGNGQSTNLSLNFTGNGPWSYIVSNYGTGTSTQNQQVISVSPSQTTNYQITGISDACGIGVPSSSVATVNICTPPSGVLSGSQVITNGQIANLSLSFTGNAPWNYNISNFGTGTTSLNPLIIGVNPSVTTTYSLISVSNSCSAGSVSGSAIVTICGTSNVVTIANPLPITEGQSTNIVLNASVAPFTYNISGIGFGTANTTPFSISVSPLTTTNYTLLSASNVCGSTTLAGNANLVVQSPNSSKKLISCFPFDGNTIDQKGINTTTNYGATLTSDRLGNSNSAYYFDGTNNMYVSPNELLNNEFTYSAWVKPTSLPLTGEIQVIFSIGGTGGDQLFAINNSYSGDTGNRPKFNLPNYVGYSQGGPYLVSDEFVIQNQWYFVAFTRTIDSLKVYVNGKKTNSIYSSGLPPYYASNTATIGSRYFGGQGFKGVLDEMKFFKGALTAEEIRILYLTQTCNFEYLEKHKVELVSCYNFSNNVTDAVNQNNGSLSNLSPVNDRFGNSNSAYFYNGSGDLSIPTTAFLLNNYSISVWVKPSTTTGVNTIFSMGSAASNHTISLINNSSTNFIPAFQFTTNLVSGAINIGYAAVNLNQWYHIVAVKEPSRIRFYINGQVVSEKGIINNVNANYGNMPYFVNLGSLNGSNKFQGAIDDLKIFNGSLYEEEVKEIFLQTLVNCTYNPCPTYKLVSGTNASDHRASILLEGINTNSVSTNVEFNGGRSILLNPGFNSNTNTVFKAEIKGCTAETNFSSNSPLTLQPGPLDGEDGDVSSIVPNNVYGNEVFLDPLSWTQSGGVNIKRSFIRFDYSALPNNAIIDSAHLSLFFSQSLVNAYAPTFSGHTSSNEIEIKRVSSFWSEASLTWNNQPSSSPVNQILLPAATAPNQNYLKIDVKNLVVDMKNNGNYGFMIKHQVEDPYKITCLTSSDEVNPLIRPKLVIYYH